MVLFGDLIQILGNIMVFIGRCVKIYSRYFYKVISLFCNEVFV